LAQTALIKLEATSTLEKELAVAKAKLSAGGFMVRAGMGMTGGWLGATHTTIQVRPTTQELWPLAPR
jgi:hypothetical protein